MRLRRLCMAGVLVGLVIEIAGAAEPRWSVETGALVRAAPAIADVDGDGKPEIIVCSRFTATVTVLKADGSILWRFRSPDEITGDPAAADINQDGRAEVVVADRSGYMTCLGYDGHPLWQTRLAAGVHLSGPTIGDLDGEGHPEIVVGTSRGEVVCLSALGKVLWTFRLPASEWRVWSMIGAALACGDVDGDGQLETLVPGRYAGLLCLSASGQVKWRFAPADRCDSAPVLGDLDGDGAVEVVVGCNDDYLRCLDGRTGVEKWRFQARGAATDAVALADLNNDGRLEIVFAPGNSLIALDASGKQLWRREGIRCSATPVIGDFNGDGKLEIVVPCSDHRLAVLAADGADVSTLPLPGETVTSGAAFARLSGDTLDLVATSFGGAITCWAGAGKQAPWPQWHSDAAVTGMAPTKPAAFEMRVLSWGTLRHGRNRAYLEVKNRGASEVAARVDAQVTGPSQEVARADSTVTLAPAGSATIQIPYELDRTGRYNFIAHASAGGSRSAFEDYAILDAYDADLRQAQADLDWLRSTYGRPGAWDPRELEERRSALRQLTADLGSLRAVAPAERPPEWRSFAEFQRRLDALLDDERLRPLSPLARRETAWQPDWRAPVMSGRDFWHVVMYEPEKWKERGLANMPFIADAALRVSANGDEFARIFARDSKARADLLASGKPLYVLNGYFGPTQRVDEATFRDFLRDFGDRFWGFSAHEWQNGATMGWDDPALRPKTRAQATEMLRAHLKKIMDLDYGYLYAGEGYHLEHHLGCAGGVGFPYAEVGENIPMSNLQIAFTRGAARQYGRPWGVYLSVWFRGGVATYDLPRPEDLRGEADSFSGNYAGHSVSLMKREYYLGYLSGATTVHHENDYFAGSIFATKQPDGKQVRLSPFGEVAERWFDITRTHDRGTPATPIALMIDRDNGFTPAEDPIWHAFRKEAPDYFLDELANTIYPWNYSTNDERGFVVSSPYGDVFDAVTQDASADALDKYATVVLMGPVTFDKPSAERLRQFVAGGGVAVLNVENARDAFGMDFTGLEIAGDPAYATAARCLLDGRDWVSDLFRYQPVELRGAKPIIVTGDGAPLVTQHEFGKGVVIVTLAPWMLDLDNRALPCLGHLLRHIRSDLLPIYVTGGVGYTVARSASGWVVGLFNNDGVTKRPSAPPEADPKAARRARIVFEGRPTGAEEWVAGEKIAQRQDGNTWTGELTVPPGDVRIVEIRQ